MIEILTRNTFLFFCWMMFITVWQCSIFNIQISETLLVLIIIKFIIMIIIIYNMRWYEQKVYSKKKQFQLKINIHTSLSLMADHLLRYGKFSENIAMGLHSILLTLSVFYRSTKRISEIYNVTGLVISWNAHSMQYILEEPKKYQKSISRISNML